jgi:hypothetical protein
MPSAAGRAALRGAANGVTALTVAAAAGDTVLHVLSNSGFHPGIQALVGADDGPTEIVVVDRLGSLHLVVPLVNSYSAGVSVKAQTPSCDVGVEVKAASLDVGLEVKAASLDASLEVKTCALEARADLSLYSDPGVSLDLSAGAVFALEQQNAELRSQSTQIVSLETKMAELQDELRSQSEQNTQLLTELLAEIRNKNK